PSVAEEVDLDPAHPARVELKLLAGLAVRDGDRGCALPEAQFLHREAIQRHVGDLGPTTAQKFANLGEADPVLEHPSSEVAAPDAALPPPPPRTTVRGFELRHDRGDHAVKVGFGGQAQLLDYREIPADRLDVGPETRGDALLRLTRTPASQDLLDLQHRDPPKCHDPSRPGSAPGP